MSYDLPSRRLLSQEDQSMVQAADVPRSRFQMAYTHKSTFDAGFLIPFLVDELLPGDSVRYNASAYIRMSTPLFPIMDNMRVDTHFFVVPNRLVWENWERFMGQQDDPDSTIEYNVPQVESAVGGFPSLSIYDYMGLPVFGQTDPAEQMSVSALPLRAHNLIINQWFRDQNLQDSLTVNRGDSADSVGTYTLFQRAKSHDYLTSCLPWPQKFVAPSVPVAGEAPIIGIGFDIGTTGSSGSVDVRETANPAVQNYANWRTGSTLNNIRVEATSALANAQPMVYADLESATGVSINVLRQSFLVQQLLERDARGGTRYTEIVFSHFKVRSPDARLQRAEFIGGGSTPLVITPVAQTAPTEDNPLGALGAAGTVYGRHSASYAATEHSIVIGFISVKSELSYSQGVHRMWDRRTRYDFYWPSLAGLGEQAVLRREIYATGVEANDNTVFGYQERFHEYRTKLSQVSGLFRPYVSGSLSQWHLSQNFATPPVLGSTFIQDNPPMARVLAAASLATGSQFLADIVVDCDFTRPMPVYGTPVMLGRF